MGTKAVTKKESTYPWLKPYRWKKGQSGNPAGRTPGHGFSLRTVLKQSLEKHGFKAGIQKMKDRGVDINDGTHGDLINCLLLYKATVMEDLDAIKEIYKQTERPLAREVDPDDPDKESNQINVTMNIVKVNSTTNIQNNINTKGKTKKVRLSK